MSELVLMKTGFDIITLTQAIAAYNIQDNIHEDADTFTDMVKEDARFYLHQGDLHLQEHFILDYDTLPEGIEGYIIDGNLQVDGSIINEEGDYGPVLYVRGNVQCRSLLIGGGPTHITGNVTAEEVIMLHYNHGWMKGPGVFTAPVMIVEDYHFIPAQKKISDFYYNDNDPDSPEEHEVYEDDEEDMHIADRLQGLLNNGLTTTYEELRRDLAAGEYVLKPVTRDLPYWQEKVNKNYRDLKRVPVELRTQELCMQALNKTVFALAYFPETLLTPELITQAVNISGMALRHLPEQYITKEICYIAAGNGGVIEMDIPEKYYDTDLFQILIKDSDWQMERIPVAYITEDLLVTYVKAGRGAWLDKYCTAAGVSKERVLHRVIDDGVEYLKNIFGWHFSAETYTYSKGLYDNEKYKEEWAAITQEFKRKVDRLQ